MSAIELNGIEFGTGALSLEDVWDIAHRVREPVLPPATIVRIGTLSGLVEKALRSGQVAYGVTTGYGDSCETGIPPELIGELPLHLTRYHRCGTGRILDETETRAVMATSLSSLVQGWSCVTSDLVQLLCEMLRRNILPRIPADEDVQLDGVLEQILTTMRARSLLEVDPA